MKYLGEKSTEESIVDKAYVDAESVHYGECSTAAATQAKAVTVNGVTALTAGVSVRIKFTNAQTYNGAPTLNVNGLGAKNIRRNGTTNAARYEWRAGEVLDLVYDGTAWIIADGGIADTTYYGLSKLSTSLTSTSTALAPSLSAINNLANYMLTGAPVYSASSTYAVGDRVRYGNYTYECNTAITTAEAWNANHWTPLDPLQKQIDAIEAEIPTKLSDLTNDEDFRGIKTGDNDPTTSDIENGEVYLKFGTPTDYGPEIEELQNDVADLQGLLGETKRASGNPATFYTEKPNGNFTRLMVTLDSQTGLTGITIRNSESSSVVNLFKPVSGTSNGVTFTPSSDGTIHISGTFTAASWTYAASAISSLADLGLAAGDSVTVYSSLYTAVEWYPATGTSRLSYTASNGTFRTVTIPANATRYRLLVYASRTLPTAGASVDETSSCLLAKGTASEWVPYADEYAVEFPAAAGTVYTGTVDLVSGELTVTDGTAATYQLGSVPTVKARTGTNSLSVNDGATIDLAYTAGLAEEVAALAQAMPVIKYGTATPTTATIGPGEFYFQISS